MIIRLSWRALGYACLTLAGVVLGGNPAIVRGQESVGARATPVVISNVAIAQDAQRIAIRIEGAGRLDAQATRIQSPERLALDFTGARLKVQKTSIPGPSAPVRGVRLGQFRPDVARVVIDLTARAPYQIAHEGDAVVVYLQVQPAETNAAPTVASTTNEQPAKQIASTATTNPPRDSVSAGSESGNPAPAHLPSSNELTQPSASSATKSATVSLPGIVQGQNSGGARATPVVISNVAITQDAQRIAIRIEGAGRLDARATRIQNPERLALDFTGARLKVQKTSSPGPSAPVRGVRLGQFRPDVARVVIDLMAAAPYQIAREGDAVVVYLKVQPLATNAAPAVASITSEKSAKQIAGVATTNPPSNSVSPSNKGSNAATARLPVTTELTQPSAPSANTTAPDSSEEMENGGDFSHSTEVKKLPTGTILLRGAWSSATDSVTPVPEGGSLDSNNVYNNIYFGLRYTLSSNWVQKYSGPPPSDSGYYVLAQIRPAETSAQGVRGSILIAAQDLFFTSTLSTDTLKLIKEVSDNLEPDYKVELPPTVFQLANHSFVRLDYGSPVADLHWRILATQIRCHALEFIVTGRDTRVTESLIQSLNVMELPNSASVTGTDGGNLPVCIKDYATGENLIEKVDPILTERKFNPIPVRIIINKQGGVKHIHFLSAFPDQANIIRDALLRWKFRPYLRNGQPLEVETGIMFGHPADAAASSQASAVSQ